MTIVLTQQCYYHKKALYNKLVAQDDRSSGKLTLLLLFFSVKSFLVATKAPIKEYCCKHWPSDWWHQMAGHHPTSPNTLKPATPIILHLHHVFHSHMLDELVYNAQKIYQRFLGGGRG